MQFLLQLRPKSRSGWLTSTNASRWFASEVFVHRIHLDFFVQDLLRKSGKKAVDDHAAVWVPDSEAGTCMHCKKVSRSFIVSSCLSSAVTQIYLLDVNKHYECDM